MTESIASQEVLLENLRRMAESLSSPQGQQVNSAINNNLQEGQSFLHSNPGSFLVAKKLIGGNNNRESSETENKGRGDLVMVNGIAPSGRDWTDQAPDTSSMDGSSLYDDYEESQDGDDEDIEAMVTKEENVGSAVKETIDTGSHTSMSSTPGNKDTVDCMKVSESIVTGDNNLSTVGSITVAKPVLGQVTDGKDGEQEIICSECGTDFTDVQSYMSHGCVQSSEESNDAKNATKLKFSERRMDEIPSDAESFDGKIVYNPDGSAYIIEGESELSDEDSLLDTPQKDGIIIDQRGKMNTSQVQPIPQIASAFYIQKNPAFYNPWYSMLPPENRPRSEAPIMHSYRVFDVRTGKNEETMNEDCDSLKATKAVDLKSGDITSVPTKPILMCFICKLSFGYAKSFVSHALAEHSMHLNDEEKCYLARKNASAIIQGIGISKDPLMSFLEPVSPPITKGEGSSVKSFIPPGVFNSKLKESDTSTNVSFVHLGSKVTPFEQRSNSADSNTSTKFNNLHHSAVMSSKHSSPNISDSSTRIGPSQDETDVQLNRVDDIPDSLSSNDTSHNTSTSSLVKSPGHKASLRDTSPSRGDMTASVSNYHSPSNHSSPGSTSSMPPLTSPPPLGSSSGTTHVPVSPKMSLPNLPVPPLVPVNTTATTSQTSPVQGIVIRAGCEDHPNGNITGDECLKCDTVLGTARTQMGNNMTMMHSRNSCKTLKCPKCNWHYKYQETLEIHMKEKHPDSDTQCIYCITKQAHPRLARGEVYTCGYKPYRCEVCNYSTTTKGNLSIHMQSDKHINNMQELQKAQAAGTVPPSQLPLTPTTPNGNHISPISSTVGMEVHIPPTTPPVSATSSLMNESSFKPATPSAAVAAEGSAKSSQKPKPSWRCDVCNYETNVARNLRIHMTSEKHTHNMMMLQQNVKHMQRDMHFQLNQMALMGPDPSMMYGLANPLGPNVPPFPFDPSMLMPPGFPNPLSSDGPMDLTKQENEQQLNTANKVMELNKNSNEASKLFQCTICDNFSADSLESLHSHMQLDRTKHGNEEHVTVINGTYICNLCQYKTNLKANFQLHCKTDKHLQRLQLVNHIREGSHHTNDEWQMKYFANISNPVQVRCTACNYYTNSIHKLQLHNSTPRHESSAKLFHHLQKREAELNAKKKYYHCALCKASCKSKVGLVDHVKTMAHMRNESLKILQHQEQGREVEFNADAIFLVKELREEDHIGFEEDSMPKETPLSPEGIYNHFTHHPHAELLATTSLPASVAVPATTSAVEKAMHLPSAATTTATLKDEHKERTSEKLYACPFCKFSSASEERLEIHVNSQHRAKVHSKEQPSEEVAPAREMACPLCQEKYLERRKIESHLVEVHNVSNEGLHRLLGLLDAQSLSASMMSINNSTNCPVAPPTTTSNGAVDHKPTSSWSAHDLTSSSVNDFAIKEENDPIAEMIENHALKLAEEASKDGINLSELTSPVSYSTHQLDEQIFRCQTCAKTFQNIDNLCNHQNELGHLELKQTPRGPGYLCWKKGCNQYFKTAEALQIHFREIHAKKPLVPVSVSEKHAYKYRCTQCSLAFKTLDKLQLHSVYHIIRNATQCCVCSRRFKTILAMRKHVESTHIDTMTPAEKEQYAASQLALLGMPGMDGLMGLQNNLPMESLKVVQQGAQFPLPLMGFPDISMSGLLSQQALALKAEAHINASGHKLRDDKITGDHMRKNQGGERVSMEVNEDTTRDVVDDSINTIALAENSYNDSSKKYKCHRCKVAFAKQSLIIQHNRTAMHKAKASKSSSSSVPSPAMANQNDSGRSASPHNMDVSEKENLDNAINCHDNSQQDNKCNTCEDVTTDKRSRFDREVHLQMLKGTPERVNLDDRQKSVDNFPGKEHTINNNIKPQNTQIIKSSDLIAKTQSTTNNNDSSKPYKCNICKVSYREGSVLDEHLESSQHQTKALKIEELIVMGEVDMTQPLIEKPDANPKPSIQTPKQNQVGAQELMKQMTSVANMPTLPFSQAGPLLFGNFPGFPSPSHLMTSQGQLQLPVVSSSVADMMLSGCMTSSALFAMNSMANSKSVENCIYTTAGKTAIVNSTEMKFSDAKPVSKEDSIQKKESEFVCEKCSGQFECVESLVKHQQMYCLMQMSSLRFKQHIQRNLLENIGFECVMQYNEYLQKPKKAKKSSHLETKAEENISETVMDTSQTATNTSSTNNEEDSCNNNKPIDLKAEGDAASTVSLSKSGGLIPEMERSVCKACSKQFSSVWVLKTHQEEVHKEVIPTELVTVVADKFRKEFDQKYPQGVTEGCNLDVAGIMADSSGKESVSSHPTTAVSIKSEENQMSSLAADLATAQASQMLPMPMFNVLPGMMPLHMGLPMNLPPHLMPVMMPHLTPNEMMSLSGMPNRMDHNALMNSQTQVSAAAAAATSSAAALAAQQKRGRTRISDEQLKVLRAHFDINNSPSEEQISKMSEQTGLPPKVIKHWFRNTLFKERQRNKDSPYNFSVPPSTQLNLEEYEKTGTWKTNNPLGQLQPLSESNKQLFLPVSQPPAPQFNSKVSMSQSSPAVPLEQPKPIVIEPQKDLVTPIKESNATFTSHREGKQDDVQDQESVTSSVGEGESMVNSAPSTPLPTTPVPVAIVNPALSMSNMIPISITGGIHIPGVSATASSPFTSASSNSNISSAGSLGMPFPPLVTPLGANPAEMSAAFSRAFSTPEKNRKESEMKQPVLGNPETMSNLSTPSTPSTPCHMSSFMGGRRANRTRFSDYQLKILQEYFEQNAYPKDDDLDHLSKLMNLSPRVIVVWFQNARQKARKSYENNPPAPLATPEEDSKYNRTPGLNYQCKRCLTVFQRYYELIKHQKTQCFKDDDDRSETNYSSCHEDDQIDDAESSDGSQKPQPLSLSSSGSKEQMSPAAQVEYKCEKCTAVFPRFDLWKEHQSFHMLNPSLFSPQSNQGTPVNPFSSFPPLLPALPSPQQFQAHLASMKQEELNNMNKRKLEEDDDDREDYQGQKRMRTTILPEQLDYLYQQYQVDCNPSRKQLEAIADHVGLKKRVVQVWFQNTRARERKGQYRAHTQIIHKRCPFCRALFRAKSALESHLATKHPEDMARGQVNIDALPDEPWDAVGPAGSSAPTTPTSSGGNLPGLDMAKLLNNPYSMPNQFMPHVPGGGGSQGDQMAENMDATMKKMYEDSLKRYMSDLNAMKEEKKERSSSSFEGKDKDSEEIPLDLSKPVDLSRALKDESLEESVSWNDSDNEISMTDSGPPSPCSTTSSAHTLSLSVTSPQHPQNHMLNVPPKRYRTQLSALQVKIMKSIYQYYKTPTMSECEMLGRVITLAKRVIQVWFQNARAKEKKAKASQTQFQSGGGFSGDLDIPPPPEDCTLCDFKYSHKYTLQDHLFSRKHIEKVSAHIKATDRDLAVENVASGAGGSSMSAGGKNTWDKNEALAQMTAMGMNPMAHMPTSITGMPGMSEKHKESEPTSEKKVKDEKSTTAHKPSTAKLSLPNASLPPSALSTGMLNPFAATAGFPGLMDPSMAAASMLPFMMPGMGGATAGMMPGMPGMGGLPFMPMGMMPGPEMFMYDPATFGTPLTLLQIPPQAIKSVQSKLQDEGCIITRYTQDCKHLVDLKAILSATDYAATGECMVDVGYICRMCQMVYPGKEACLNHQLALCYASSSKNLTHEKTIVKLEQIQYECKACEAKFSMLQELKLHCEMDGHKQKVRK